MFDENSNSTGLIGPTVTAPSMPPTGNLNNAQMVNQLLTMKDSRWLQLEVCREFQRGQCSRSDADCKFAHPPAHVDVQNGRVTACYDSIKGRCTRENPKCKYMHPTPQQKEQLLVNGKNNLALKNMLCAQLVPPAGIPNNLQLAQLMQQQQQQQPLMPTLPYPFYSPLTAIYPFAGADPYVQTATSAPNGVANGKRHGDKNGLPTNGIPIYQAAAQFNPYMMQQMPGFVPVSFNGQLPPRL